MQHELAYWVTLALMPKIWTRRKNELLDKCHERACNIVDLFESEILWSDLGMTSDEIISFRGAKSQLTNQAFLVEDLLNQGYDIIPSDSPLYSDILKDNMQLSSPIVLFTKGNKQLLKEKSVAIVGCRKADDISLRFTDSIAYKSSLESKVIVSGFADGVDRRALDSALSANGKSIIVLPQGITTFSKGYQLYYKPISQGDVLVVSIFHPKSSWSVELAMGRNPIIYGLAEEIYVAQTDDKGGTWSGAIDGLKKGRAVYVRIPENGEKNANQLLLGKGAKPVGLDGVPLPSPVPIISDPPADYQNTNDMIKKLLSQGAFSTKEIIGRLNLVNWSDVKLKKLLRTISGVEEIKGKPIRFTMYKEPVEPTLF